MKVMGIDPSTRTGLALVSEGSAVLAHKELEFKKLGGFERINALVGGVFAFHEEHQPDLVVIEGMFVGHASSAVITIQIATLIRYFFWQEGIPYLEIDPNVLKKFVTGKGQSKKEEIMMYVLKRWGFESPTNNIADAVALSMAGVCCAGGNFGLASRSALNNTLKGLDPQMAEILGLLRQKYFCS